ncbi:putative methyltransferase YrrT [compost metagenome]
MGAGTGNLAAKLISQDARMSAVDQSKEMLRLCQSKYPTIETRLGNFLAIPYLGGEFDFVVSSFSFHHLTPEQQLLALAEMRRVLKPYGRICMAILTSTVQPPREPIDAHAFLSALLQWFENHRYVVKQQQMNDCLHVIYAIPLRT